DSCHTHFIYFFSSDLALNALSCNFFSWCPLCSYHVWEAVEYHIEKSLLNTGTDHAAPHSSAPPFPAIFHIPDENRHACLGPNTMQEPFAVYDAEPPELNN
ncbi:unnamed protein product, partial [Ectocarpus fasciculatus]